MRQSEQTTLSPRWPHGHFSQPRGTVAGRGENFKTATMKKRCCGCKRFLNKNLFGLNRTTKDGFQTYCKECKRIYGKINRQHSRELQRITQPAWRKKNSRKVVEYFNQQRARNPQKVRCRQIFRQEVKMGRIVPEPCEVCGAIPTEAHHPNYSKPFKVNWLCTTHHSEVHRGK